MCVACTVRYVLGCMCGTILVSCLCSMHSLIALAVLCIALSYLSDVMCCAYAVQYSVLRYMLIVTCAGCIVCCTYCLSVLLVLSCATHTRVLFLV